MAVGGSASAPVVIERRHIELADPAFSGSQQPFHAAEKLALKEAEKLVERYADSTRALARRGMRKIIDDLRKTGCQVVGSCILLSSGRPVGTLASTLASHAMIHTAEGEFFREAIRQANQECGVPVTGIKEREIFSRASGELDIPVEELKRRTGEMGRSLGPPWRQDEKMAALAAWLNLET